MQSNEHGKIKIYKPKRTDRVIKISGGDGGIGITLESFNVNVAMLDWFFFYKNNFNSNILNV